MKQAPDKKIKASKAQALTRQLLQQSGQLRLGHGTVGQDVVVSCLALPWARRWSCRHVGAEGFGMNEATRSSGSPDTYMHGLLRSLG